MYVCPFYSLSTCSLLDVSFIKQISRFPGCITDEPIWTFDVNYVNQKKIGVRSYVQLFAALYVFSTIVPSYAIYVKRPHKFLHTVRTLHKKSVVVYNYIFDIWGITLSLPLALPYQHVTG